MRPILAVLAWSAAVSASSAYGEQKFPYKAYVNANLVYVRSGPGQNYYPTDTLKLGQEVEIYRHDPGGWYAIKPVEESFCWVSAKYLKPERDHLATITDEQVACRVGSRFSDIRDVIQVRLHRGETVELLDAKPAGPEAEAKGWYKIAPPAGEFRWVFGKYVDAEYPRDGVSNASALTATGRDRDASAAEQTADASRHDGDPHGHSRAKRPGGKSSWSAARAGAETEEPTAQADDDLEESPHARHARRTASPEQFQAALEAIDLELSTMVVEEPTVWTFDTLRQRSETLVNQAETALERGRARWLLSRINRFADIKQRYDDVAALGEETERSNHELASLSPKLRPEDRSSQAGRFDGVGRLVEINSPKLGAPRYALVDERGNVRYYVSPAPGVNLRYYVGRQIGVNGTRGYVPEQRAQHLMARYVTVMDDRVVR